MRSESPQGGLLRPLFCLPQQATVLSVRTPHVKNPSADTCENAPAGGLLWPEASSPQQATVPSVLTPHV